MMLAGGVFAGQQSLDRERHIEITSRVPFVVGDIKITPYAVEIILVSATCNLRETTQHRVEFLNLIRQINGSLSQAQMRRLDADPACKDPVVRSTLSELLEENGYRQIDKLLDDAAMDLFRRLKSKP